MQKLHGNDVEETVTPLEVEAAVGESVESVIVQEIPVDANLAAVEVEEEPRTEEVAPDTVAGARYSPPWLTQLTAKLTLKKSTKATMTMARRKRPTRRGQRECHGGRRVHHGRRSGRRRSGRRRSGRR